MIRKLGNGSISLITSAFSLIEFEIEMIIQRLEQNILKMKKSETQAIKSVRESKGKSSILFPDDYVVVDIETTGLSPQYDEIIEIAAIKYKSGEKADCSRGCIL